MSETALSNCALKESSHDIFKGIVDIEGRGILHLGVNHGGVSGGRCLVGLGNEGTQRILSLGSVKGFGCHDLNVIVVGRLVTLGIELVVRALFDAL